MIGSQSRQLPIIDRDRELFFRTWSLCWECTMSKLWAQKPLLPCRHTVCVWEVKSTFFSAAHMGSKRLTKVLSFKWCSLRYTKAWYTWAVCGLAQQKLVEIWLVCMAACLTECRLNIRLMSKRYARKTSADRHRISALSQYLRALAGVFW